MHCLSEIEILDINSSTHICKIDTHQSWSKAPIFAFGTNFEEALNESLILEKLNLKCNHFRNNIKLGLKLSNVGKWTAKCFFSCPSTLAVDPITTAIQPSNRTFEQCVFIFKVKHFVSKRLQFSSAIPFFASLDLGGSYCISLCPLWPMEGHTALQLCSFSNRTLKLQPSMMLQWKL